MSIQALRNQAFSQHENGDLDAAERAYVEVLQHTPDDWEIVHALGLLAVQRGRFGDALDLIGKVLRARETAGGYADLGNALCGLSRFEDAVLSYDRAIALQVNFAEAHLNRAGALRRLGRRAAALDDYDRAIAAQPAFYEAHVGRADLLRELGRGGEALADYARAVNLRSDLPGTYLKQTLMLLEAGNWAEALKSIDQAGRLGMNSVEALTLRGVSQAGLKLHEEAMKSYDAAIAREPAYVLAHINRGSLLRDCNRPADALASYGVALALDADSFEALCNRAAVLIDLRRFDEALLDCDRAGTSYPNRAEPHLHRATALLGLDRFEHALESYDYAIALKPDYAEAHAGRSGALQYLGRHSEALLSSEKSVALAPRLAAGYFNRGAALRDLVRIEEAVTSFERARSLQPEDPDTNCNLGGLLLSLGRFDLGWGLYEWRSKMPDAPKVHRFRQAAWDGEADIRGKKLFVYLDQGLGDTIQFARYVRLAEMRGADVVMAVQNRLRRLLSSLSPTVLILGETETPDTFDYHCPLASLPGAFRTTLETIPADVPYLAAEPDRCSFWRSRLGEEGFKIGICWHGSTIKTGMGRSFPLHLLRGISSLPAVRLVSLQQGVGTEQLGNLPAGMAVQELGEEFDSGPDAFLDAAAVMQSLDLIITCDTSIAHLAGALGRPTWVVLKRVPDWRWMLDRDDSPWYPTLRVFRQRRAGIWNDVFDAMHRELYSRLVIPN